MTDAANPAAGTPAPAAPPTNAAPPAVTAAPAAPPPAAAGPTPQVGEPDWLNGRIAQAKTNAVADLVKSLGVASVDEAKAAVEASRAAADAKKSVEQKNAEINTALAVERERASGYEAIIKARAAAELATLTPEQRAAVEALAGDDVGSQLVAIDTLRPTWSKATATAPTAPAPKPAPASTTGATGAPAANAGPAPQIDHAAVYDDLKVRNPMFAAHYQERHAAEITAARKAKGAA